MAEGCPTAALLTRTKKRTSISVLVTSPSFGIMIAPSPWLLSCLEWAAALLNWPHAHDNKPSTVPGPRVRL